MSRTSGTTGGNGMVPFGYEPEPASRKGSLWVYDAFEHDPERLVELALTTARERKFARVVLYPLHEETMKRMTREPVAAFYKREKRLEELVEAAGEKGVVIDRWEGKRKAYTPMEAALRHLGDAYPSPVFLLLQVDLAERFASYEKPFEEWIRKLRLLIVPQLREPAHPRLMEHASRWELLAPHRSE